MDAKDLRIETALGERNDDSKYSQSGVTLQCNRNKPYQDIGSNPLAKAEVAGRPCAVIGPDRVVPPPVSNDAYLKKASVDLWPCPDTLYLHPPEYPHKQINNVNPSRNISPRQTFQENMQRIMVPPTYSAGKHADDPNLNHVQDRNAALSKNNKQTMAPEAKYCDVPYSVNLLTNELKNVRETEMCAPSVNSPLTRTAPHGWPASGVNLHAPRTYGAHDVYQYPQFPSCAGPRPPAMPMARPHRTFQEDGSYVYPDPYYQDASVRFKPYPSVKERYPHARYDYISNYPSPFHPPPAYASHKYDIPNTRPHPYPVYPHLKYVDNRVPEPNIEGYQRPNQQSINYNMPFRNQIIHPTYAPVLGNTQNKLPSYPPDKSSNKLSLDNSKAYVDYENAKAKYSLPDSYFVSEMARIHQVPKPIAMPNYTSPGIHPVPLQQYHRKDNMPMKTYEYMPHYRHFEHPIGFNHPPQFSPSTLAISPTDSNTSNDTTQTQGTSQEDCGYVSQSSTTSIRSGDSNINRLHNEYYRRYDYRYRPIIGNSHMMPKSDLISANSKENNKIDVRQFLSMWNEGDEDSTNNNTKEISVPNNYRRQESAKSQDQLYVLGLVNVPSEELAKYEHIQKVSKLPENIKGYNSIELLNQFEEVIESSNMSSFKPSTSKEFMPMKDRKNAIKQIVEVLPRPVSPLDVEAKISQSVIHKEVGCNFEIKPCSPKMMNVEIAAPMQNILGERAIEKVSNPHSNKAKSPLSMRLDGNTAYNKIQRQESTHTPFENVSCKMIGSPFTANNMESVKTNYSLHDLETSSGVCLASLPRLDNEIELSFPEVNQQFINANKASNNLHEKHPEDVGEGNLKSTTSADTNKPGNGSEKYTNISTEDSCAELTKLSKYRKTKVNSLEYPEDESNANAIRTDSVIIANPENVRKIEENRENISSHRTVGEEEYTPMNLTSQNSFHKESESNTTENPKSETDALECALDFSLSKSENGLALIDAHDELINTAQKEMPMGNVASYFNVGNDIKQNITEGPNKPFKSYSECASYASNTKSIIVRNNQNSRSECSIISKEETTTSDVGQSYAPLETPEKSDDYLLNLVESKIVSDNDEKTINFDRNKTRTEDKASSTNVIVKHKHKKKSKTSKAKADVIPSHSDQKLRNKNTKIESSLLDKHLNHVVDSKRFERKSNNSKSVIQNNNVSDENLRMEEFDSGICKDKAIEKNSSPNNLDKHHNSKVSEREDFVEKPNIIDDQPNSDLTVNEEAVNSYTKVIDASARISDENNFSSKSQVTDMNLEINDTTFQPPLIPDKGKVFESNTGINQAHKYYNDLISEKELFLDKTYCVDVVNKARINLNDHEDDATKHVVNYVEQNLETIKNHIHDKSEILEPSVEKNYSNRNRSGCERNIVDSLSDEIKMEDTKSTTVDHSERHCAVVLHSKLNVDKKYSIDSGFQSSKSSFAENDDSMVIFPGNSSEDSVFVEQESGSNKIPPNVCDDNNSGSKDIFQLFSDECTATSTCSNFVETIVFENKISEHSNQNNKMETQTNTLQSSAVFDNVDANMEILFAQQNEEIHSDNRNVDNIDVQLQTDEDLVMALRTSESNRNNLAEDQALEDTKNKSCANEHIKLDFNINNANTKMEIEDDSFVVQCKDQNNIDSEPVENKDIMGTDEPFAKLLNTSVHVTSYVKKRSGYQSKELYSPRIQKLIMYNEGKTNIQIFEGIDNIYLQTHGESYNINSLKKPYIDSAMKNYDNVDNKLIDKADMDSIILNDDVEAKSFDNVKQNDDVEVKLFQEPNIESPTQNNGVEDKLLEKSNFVNILQNGDVKVKSVKELNIKTVKQNEYVEGKFSGITIIDSIMQNDNIEVKSLVKPNVDSVIQNDDFEDKSLEKSNIVTVTQNDDVEVKLTEEQNVESVEHNNDVEVKSFELPIIDSVIRNAVVEDYSLENSNIVSVIQNDDVEVKSIEEPNIESVIQNDDVEIKSFEFPINDSAIRNANIEDKSLEKSNIVNFTQNDYVEVKVTEKPNIKSVIQNNDVEAKSLEIPINDTVTQIDYVESNSLEKPNISKVIQNDDNEDKSLEESNIVRVLQNVDVEVKSIEEPNIECVIQNDDVEIKSFEFPIIDSVFQNADVEVKPHEMPIVLKEATFDDPVNEGCPQTKTALIQDVYLKKELGFEKISSVTNENSIDSNGSNCTPSISMDSINSFDVMSSQEKTIEVNVVASGTERENKSGLENDLGEDCDVQNDLIDTQDISFSYPNNSIISQITANIFHRNDNMLALKYQNNNEKYDVNSESINKHSSPINHRISLKRSFSDSALNANVGRNYHSEVNENLHYTWAPKRNKINDFENYLPNNRRNSVNIEENVSFCILIDDNCIITEENEDKISIADLQEEYITEIETENDCDKNETLKEFHSSTYETDVDLTHSVVLECEEENPIQGSWIEDITSAEDIFSDEVAENVVISAPSSPTDSATEFEYDESGIYGSTSSCSHIDRVKFIHGEKMSEDDAHIVEALYRTPHMNIMNKTLLYGDKNVESDSDQENILLESDDWKQSPTPSPDYIDPTHASNDFRLETPENKENVFVKELSPLRRIDDYLDVSSAENEADDHNIVPHHVPEVDKTIQDGNPCSCESSLDTVFDYKLKGESAISTTTPSSSSSPEVSSTTSEEKNSGILLKITNLNGSRVSQINKIETNNRPRCKFTEKKEYSTSDLNFPNGPLITKAAQKYIPPIKESIRDLKVKITLPQQSLLKLKQLKLSRNESKVHKKQNIVPRITKKPKPNFDDVLKSIDEIQIKRHKEKSKKSKTVVPKVLIKKNENGSHYASTPNRDTFSPDLTGRKWQPWVFLEKNHFIDKMAIKNKSRAIFNHRKKNYVLAEKFKKYKSVSSAKFVISQPKTPGQLKYTIRLKHSF